MKLVFRSKNVETSLLQLCTEGAVLDTPQFPYAKLVKNVFDWEKWVSYPWLVGGLDDSFCSR